MNMDELNTVGDIDAVIAQLRERRKELKAQEKEAEKAKVKAEKAAKLEAARKNVVELINDEQLQEGTEVTVILYGENHTANFVKATDKRIIVAVNGDNKTLPFDKFVRIGDAESVADENEDEAAV